MALCPIGKFVFSNEDAVRYKKMASGHAHLADGEGTEKLPKNIGLKYERHETRLEFLSKKSIELRRKILGQTSPGIADCIHLDDGTYIQITYKGRGAMQQIGSRLNRVGGMGYDEFSKQLALLKNRFKGRAKNAGKILKILSKSLGSYDEIHLRAASIGISGIEDSPHDAANLFKDNLRDIRPGTQRGEVS